jgi:hypothetical protein
MDQSTRQPRETRAQAGATIPLRNGDVRALQVIVTDGQIIIAVFDEADSGRPLIQAVLDQSEQASLVHALWDRVWALLLPTPARLLERQQLRQGHVERVAQLEQGTDLRVGGRVLQLLDGLPGNVVVLKIFLPEFARRSQGTNAVGKAALELG